MNRDDSQRVATRHAGPLVDETRRLGLPGAVAMLDNGYDVTGGTCAR